MEDLALLVAKSLLAALVLSAVFSAFFPLMPTTGMFASLTPFWKAAAVFILGVIVVGPGRIVYELFTGSGF